MQRRFDTAMTYIDLINDFWQEFEGSDMMKPIDALMYLYLLKTCNSRGWENPFDLSNKRLRICLGMTDKRIIESRERLVEQGLIEATPGERNRATPTYKLTRLCFRMESKKGSKKASKREAKGKQKDSKNESLYIDLRLKTKDKDYFVVDAMTPAEFLKNFFRDERRATIDALCMNNHTDEATLRRLASEVLTDWQATDEPKHHDINEAQKHLLSQMRIKLNIEHRQQKSTAGIPATGNQAADKAPRKVNDQWANFQMPED